MDIIDAPSLRVLRYVWALNSNGQYPPAEAINAYGQADRVRGRSDIPGVDWPAAATFSSYFELVGWITSSENQIALTPEGHAVLRSSALRIESGYDDLIEAIDNPGDRFPYSKLARRVALIPDMLVIDSYVGLKEMVNLAGIPNVNRVLTSIPYPRDEEARTRVAQLSLKFARNIELRAVADGVLNERLIVPSQGGILRIGSGVDWNSRGVSIVSELGANESATLRAAYEQIWRDARGLTVN